MVDTQSGVLGEGAVNLVVVGFVTKPGPVPTQLHNMVVEHVSHKG